MDLISDTFDRTSEILQQEIYMDFRGSDSLEILKSVVDVFHDQPASYLERGYQEATLSIPTSKWMDVFLRPFEEVVGELQQTEVYKVNTFENGYSESVYSGPLVFSYGVRYREVVRYSGYRPGGVQVRRTRNVEEYYIKFDRRLLSVMEYILEPSQIKRLLETGLIQRNHYRNNILNL